MPVGFDTYAEALHSVALVYQVLKKLLAERGLSGGIGDEVASRPTSRATALRSG